MENAALLVLSVSLSAGRNAISKKTGVGALGRASFFLSQAVLFFAALLMLGFFGIGSVSGVSRVTWIYGLLYGIFLILSQWMLTLALKNGSTSVCSVIYALGFLLPTLSGVLFWHEDFSLFQGLGLVSALCVILLTFQKGEGGSARLTFLPYILIAMLASGGLGIMQKLQQAGESAHEKNAFLLIAFAVAFLASLIAFFCCPDKKLPSPSLVIPPAVTGVCFGGANLCNTVLAGRMESAVFFPLQNISTILLSTLLGIVLFRERITPRIALMLAFGVVTVLIFSL